MSSQRPPDSRPIDFDDMDPDDDDGFEPSPNREALARRLRTAAAMEGEQVVAANIGDAVDVSDMELICLATFAEIGVLSLLGEELRGSSVGDEVVAMRAATIEAVRHRFGRGGLDGLVQLRQTACAVLRSERIRPYVVASPPVAD